MTANSKTYVLNLLKSKNLNVASDRALAFEEFVQSSLCMNAVNSILENQSFIMENWNRINRVLDIKNQQVVIPNATIGKNYTAFIDIKSLDWEDLAYKEFVALEEFGLSYNSESNTIVGTPTRSGDVKLKFLFKVKGEHEDSEPNEKLISLVINPDPKSLWKDIPSDKTDPFWKEDDVAISESIGDRRIVVSSKRGRAHKNVGSFRDDDFAFKHFEDLGWSVVAVSDGAGSYSLSRKGSEIACRAVIEYFSGHLYASQMDALEDKLQEFGVTKAENALREAEVLSKKTLYQATVFVHNSIKEHAEKTYSERPELFNNPKAKTQLDYYHCTLIFALFKKFEFGYVILTFGVGDCPISVMNLERTRTSLLNWLDVGEFGGGTRFITQPSIFHSQEHPMVSRFNFQIVPDFSYLFLMTDGIYDPKFVVEANLERSESWNEFLKDLEGNNEAGVRVDFDRTSSDIEEQLSSWMDFWSTGNHDDRTLAIVF